MQLPSKQTKSGQYRHGPPSNMKTDPCECVDWCRDGRDMLSKHHPRCEHYTPPPADPRSAQRLCTPLTTMITPTNSEALPPTVGSAPTADEITSHRRAMIWADAMGKPPREYSDAEVIASLTETISDTGGTALGFVRASRQVAELLSQNDEDVQPRER
jgi:hypothetical protein